jgi:hypothetical protein
MSRFKPDQLLRLEGQLVIATGSIGNGWVELKRTHFREADLAHNYEESSHYDSSQSVIEQR